MTNDNASTFLAELRRTLAEAPDGVDVSAITAAIEAIENPGEARTKIWFPSTVPARCSRSPAT